MHAYQKKELKRLKSMYGPNAWSVKIYASRERALEKPYRMSGTTEQNYIEWLSINKKISYSDALDCARNPEYGHEDNQISMAPTGCFKFNDVPLDGVFDDVMKKVKKYKMSITVEKCAEGKVSGFAV